VTGCSSIKLEAFLTASNTVIIDSTSKGENLESEESYVVSALWVRVVESEESRSRIPSEGENSPVEKQLDDPSRR
jgi:hypothetical protein